MGVPAGLLAGPGGHARSAVGLRHWRAGARWKGAFSFTGYALLGLTVAIALGIGRPENRLYKYGGSLAEPYCQICPGRQILPLLQGDPGNFLLFDRYTPLTQAMSVLAMATVLLFLLGAPALRRFWCRICVLGILMEFLRVNRWSLARLTKDAHRCTYCGSCERACPMDLGGVYAARATRPVRLAECHLCLKCVEACPEDDALVAQWAGRNIMRSKFLYVQGKIRAARSFGRNVAV